MVLNYQSRKASSTARRRFTVLVSLIGVLTFTSALLLALAPAPLNPQASSSLFAIDAPQSLDVLFDSPNVPVQAGRWHYIYLHHSQSVSGNAQILAEQGSGLCDHFVIGNGDGCGDGEVQVGQRWTQQLEPGKAPGANWMLRSDCISICLIGDFNQTRPTPTQQRRLIQLVSTLQGRLQIPRSRVLFDVKTAGPVGVGGYFPERDVYSQILP